MDRNKKEQVVSQLKECFQEAQATFVADFKGIGMESLGGLRMKVREAGGQFQVAKNTLIKIATQDTGAVQLDKLLVGNNALAFTTGDPAALAKALAEYAKANDKFIIKAGVLGDKFLDAKQVKALSSLPSREVMLGSFLGTLNAVPTSFVRVLAAVPQKLVYALAAIRDQKEAA